MAAQFVADRVQAARAGGDPQQRLGAEAMLGERTAAARSLGETFSRAAATFTATGRPTAAGRLPYDPADPSTVRHFA